jgi:hypothetical protein
VSTNCVATITSDAAKDLPKDVPSWEPHQVQQYLKNLALSYNIPSRDIDAMLVAFTGSVSETD